MFLPPLHLSNSIRRYFLLILLLNFPSISFGQSQQTIIALKNEDAAAASFYAKKITNNIERLLAQAEVLFLQNEYEKMEDTLRVLKTLLKDNCIKGHYYLLTSLLQSKQSNYQSAVESVHLAHSLSKFCDENFNAQINYWEGYIHLSNNALPQAAQCFRKAKSYYSKYSELTIKNAKLNFWQGTLKINQNDYDSAHYYLSRAENLFENTPLDKSLDLIKVYNNLGAAFANQWDYKNALLNYNKAIDLNLKKVGNKEELILAHANLGSFYSNFSNFTEAERCYAYAFDLLTTETIETGRKATILKNYGICLSEQYKNAEAVERFIESKSIIYPNRNSYGGSIYASILNCLFDSYTDLGDRRKARLIKEEFNLFLTENKEKFARLSTQSKYMEVKDILAEHQFSEALLLIDSTLAQISIDDPFYSSLLLSKIKALDEVGQIKESKKLIMEMIHSYEGKYTKNDQHLLLALNDLGAAYINDSPPNYDSATYYLELSKSRNLLSTQGNLKQLLYASKIEWIASNYNLLDIALIKYNEKKEPHLLEQAERLITSSLVLLESKRYELGNNRDVELLNSMVKSFFDKALQYYFTFYTATSDKQYIDKAFLINEKSKNQGLQRAIKLDRIKTFAGVTEKVTQEEKMLTDLSTQLEYQYSQEIATQDEPSPDLLLEYSTKWSLVNERMDILIDSMKNNLPNYYNLKFNRSTTEVGQIQTDFLSKEKDMAWVSYYVGYTDCYAIVITHDHKYFLKLDPTEKIIRQLKSFNNYVSHHINEELQQTSYKLYMGLFQQIDSCLKIQTKKIKKVVVIPDGALNYLNFELLGKPKNKSWHYALYDYQFSYGYSSTLLFNEFSDQPKWKPGTLSMIGFAPEFVKSSSMQSGEMIRDANEKPGYDFFDFSPLEKNQEEVSHVAQILKQKKINSTLYLGSKADESSFKKADLNAFNIIHLATHGFVSEHQQNIAGIAFSKNENSNDDGILYMDEIFNLKNRANLVCLSACETGSGVLQQGEGLVGLTRAFIYSGAQNLVVSLWKVQDESTAALMTNFYSSLVKNQSVSESLQHAKIAMIKKNPTIHPYYWSAFIHVGLN
jgi:CHAT domain-containing protein/Flp pilus assembly protein TadD